VVSRPDIAVDSPEMSVYRNCTLAEEAFKQCLAGRGICRVHTGTIPETEQCLCFVGEDGPYSGARCETVDIVFASINYVWILLVICLALGVLLAVFVYRHIRLRKKYSAYKRSTGEADPEAPRGTGSAEADPEAPQGTATSPNHADTDENRNDKGVNGTENGVKTRSSMGGVTKLAVAAQIKTND